ncbi:GSU3473 family protein [Geothermobacter hydrogeniphilus]|uniref:Uncharacterized protein n=1 Tax=Geothermobacter hydrogeniphilus TaxID=1969733 RepID=A0A1X0YCW8_9BACT|nr:hypothetical protein [Geothermobacter hydrogeniphilus]ORJ63018.1 hypothetical protein B5V00_02925 [Geothermobacter hydrogeniphilus]
MMIPVVYLDGRHDFVKPAILDQLLEKAAISRFRRAEGWVDVATGPLRGRRRVYSFPERRAALRNTTGLQ